MTIAAFCGVFKRFTPSATIRSASISRPLSVSSRIDRQGSSIAIWNISFFFFSPPEKPSLTDRLFSLSGNSSIFFFSRIRARNSRAESGSLPSYSRFALIAVRMKLVILTPGISTGYWKLRNTPARARTSGSIASRFSPFRYTSPPVTSYAGLPVSTALSVDLPAPFGPMMACTSPSLMTRFTPFNISLPPMEACRSFISNNLLILYFLRSLRRTSPSWSGCPQSGV